MRHSIAWPWSWTWSCVQVRPSPLRDADLLADQVDAADHLGHRMLDLQPGVHLDEVEFAVLVEELDGAGAAIAHFGHRLAHDARPSRRARRGVMTGEGASSSTFWWRRWSEQSRSPRWIAAALAVAEHLELDVARVGEIFLHVDGVVAEGRARFRRRLAHQAFELVFGFGTTFMPRPPPPDAALIRTG